jgi:hypothetical protein
MIIEQFVVFWLTVTFHRQNLSIDKYANSINKVGEWGGVNLTTPHSPSTSSHHLTPLSAPRSFPENCYSGPIPSPHGAYYSHYNSVHSYNSPQYPSSNNSNPF